MLWSDLLAAFALYLVLEGLLPFASPQRWRRSLLLLGQLGDRELRIGGLVIMLAGLFLLYLVRA
ncbi:MAG: DUF2065 domain-containing protein [Gammaproteobacteria bacterium]|nr:DUF2065 domain-containing protein [Gammaproteobacteria bacterium]